MPRQTFLYVIDKPDQPFPMGTLFEMEENLRDGTIRLKIDGVYIATTSPDESETLRLMKAGP